MELRRFEDAYKQVRTPVEEAATPAMHGEYTATRALVLSLLGRDEEALDVARPQRAPRSQAKFSCSPAASRRSSP